MSAEPGPDRIQSLIEIPTALSGSITIALIVLLGIFAYPWLLERRNGRTLVALATLLLAALFMAFEAGNEAATATRIVLAGLLGLAPAVAGIIVMRLQRRARP
jgi:drug/metabolite transporter (DMT)-like permease